MLVLAQIIESSSFLLSIKSLNPTDKLVESRKQWRVLACFGNFNSL